MNPFEKRATEFVRDPMAFLPYVTPEPLLAFLESYAKQDVLLDRLVMIIGAPGSGKTTLARLFLYPTLHTLLKSKTLAEYASLADALTKCGALDAAQQPAVAGCRIPMETDYRECWELPYDEELRNNLMFSLLQARTVLNWLRGFEEVGIDLKDVVLIPRPDAAAALDSIGGTELASVREFARRVESETYRVTGSLVPPPADGLPSAAIATYRPFDVVEAFELRNGATPLRVKPLLICDDAHSLHPKQLEAMIRWLARREIRISRWVLTRMDALRPHEVLRPDSSVMSQAPGLAAGRDFTIIWMQSNDTDRRASRRAFRKIARDMSNRYLQQMPVFSRRRLVDLEQLLDVDPPTVAPGKIAELAAATQPQRLKISAERHKEFEGLVDEFLAGDERHPGPAVRLAMIRILAERYLKRVPQNSLFPAEEDPEPKKPLKASPDLRTGAEIQLLHQMGRPFFYGFDMLCDVASENAERFLRLAAYLVGQLETQLIRDADNRLPAALQNRLLRDRASKILDEEDFPERTRVMKLATLVAAECVAKTLEANASLADGANAWGIPQEEFDSIAEKWPELARVLQYGAAYNVFGLVRDYGTKGQRWCLIELSGTFSLAHGLTVKRGGFLERRAEDLLKAIDAEVSA